MNLNPVHESTPVDVRFYQLTDDRAFMTAPFESLWTDASAALGGNLIGQPLVKTVYPAPLGEPPVSLQLTTYGADVHFIGVLALFRGNDGGPRQVAVATSQLDDGVLELTGYSVRFNTGAAPAPSAKADSAEDKPAETTADNAPASPEDNRRSQKRDGRK